jgi:hypothetical protein
MLVSEPLKWCRILSAVMPKGKFIVRRKGTGGANDFVMEIRGDKQIIKTGFRVNDKGLLELNGHEGKAFESVEALAQAISKYKVKAPPTRLTTNEVSQLNVQLSKEQMMATLYEDTFFMNVIQHLELKYDDDELWKQYKKETTPPAEKDRIKQLFEAGYVRASINPCSFPCFTHVIVVKENQQINVVKENQQNQRVCFSNGKLCEVNNTVLTPNMQLKNDKAKQIEDLVQQIRTSNKLGPAEKEQFIKELDAIKDDVDLTKPIRLFIPTTKEIKLVLYEIKPQEVKAKAVIGYFVADDVTLDSINTQNG